MRVLSRCSTGLRRHERRNPIVRGGKTALTVYSYNQAAAITGLARRTLERLIALSEGPAVIELSPRRRGILETDLRIWLEQRRRPAPNEAPAPALPPPSLEPIRRRTRPSRIPACLRAPGDEESALVNVTETEPMLMTDFLKGCVNAEELEPGSCTTARIMAVDSREFEEGKKGVLFLDVFNGRGLVLNQTNLKTLMDAFGRNSENWVGQDVSVKRTLAPFRGKPVPAIRLEAVRRPAVTAPPVAPTPKLAATAPLAATATFSTGIARPVTASAPETPTGSEPPPPAPPHTTYDGPADPEDDIPF
jgi:hypothetical protein